MSCNGDVSSESDYDEPKRIFVPQKAIKRSHILAALNSVVYRTHSAKERIGSNYSSIVRSCSLDLCGSTFKSKSPTKKQVLLFTLRNSIGRHDWSTAAQCVAFLLDISCDSAVIYRSILLILFNHPSMNEALVRQFLNEVLNLRTKADQLTFLRKCFQLPEELNQYGLHSDLNELTAEEVQTVYSNSEEDESDNYEQGKTRVNVKFEIDEKGNKAFAYRG